MDKVAKLQLSIICADTIFSEYLHQCYVVHVPKVRQILTMPFFSIDFFSFTLVQKKLQFSFADSSASNEITRQVTTPVLFLVSRAEMRALGALNENYHKYKDTPKIVRWKVPKIKSAQTERRQGADPRDPDVIRRPAGNPPRQLKFHCRCAVNEAWVCTVK